MSEIKTMICETTQQGYSIAGGFIFWNVKEGASILDRGVMSVFVTLKDEC